MVANETNRIINEIQTFIFTCLQIITKNAKTKINNDNTKSESNQEVVYENKNALERGKYLNINKNLTPDKNLRSKFKTKNHIIKKNRNNKNFSSSNNSAKNISYGIKRKFKTFLVKNKNKSKYRQSHSSKKNTLSINILNRIQEVKKNKIENNFYKTSKTKNLSDINNLKNQNNLNNLKNKYNIINLAKTPSTKTKKIEFFKKNNTNKKIKENNNKEKSKNNYMSSFSIKVNRTYFNKDKKDNLKETS